MFKITKDDNGVTYIEGDIGAEANHLSGNDYISGISIWIWNDANLTEALLDTKEARKYAKGIIQICDEVDAAIRKTKIKNSTGHDDPTIRHTE